MPRRFASLPGSRALAAAIGRFGAWLGVLALVVQLLAPLSAVRAEPWMEEGLFPPTCSVHQADQGAADQDLCRQCPLCQAQVGVRLPTPLSPPTVVRVAVATVSFPILRQDAPAAPATQPPLPSRGPPAAA